MGEKKTTANSQQLLIITAYILDSISQFVIILMSFNPEDIYTMFHVQLFVTCIVLLN